MYCNKCRYVSYDYLSSCPKCGQDWSEERKKMGLDWIVKQEHGWLETKTAADSHVSERLPETGTGKDGFQFRDEEDVLIKDNESTRSGQSLSGHDVIDDSTESMDTEVDNQLESRFLDSVDGEEASKNSSDSSRRSSVGKDDEIEFPDLEFIDSSEKP